MRNIDLLVAFEATGIFRGYWESNGDRLEPKIQTTISKSNLIKLVQIPETLCTTIVSDQPFSTFSVAPPG